MKSAESKWGTAGANDYIIRVVSEGIPFHLRRCPRQNSARDNMLFVKDEVRKVVQKGCVAEVKERPFVVNP